MTLRLADLEKPLDDVEFPNGAIHKPVPFGKEEYRLWRDLQTETDAMTRGRMLLQIVTACYPKATAEDLDSCTPKMLIAMAAHAGRKIEQIMDALKNVDVAAMPETPPSPANPPATTPSSPKTNGPTSSRSTRRRSGKTRGESTTASHMDAPSSSGTGTTTLKNPDASTPFAVNWTTSTEPASPPTP